MISPMFDIGIGMKFEIYSSISQAGKSAHNCLRGRRVIVANPVEKRPALLIRPGMPIQSMNPKKVDIYFIHLQKKTLDRWKRNEERPPGEKHACPLFSETNSPIARLFKTN